jgi:ComF family protein
VLTTIARDLANFVYPPACAVCRAPIDSPDERFCGECGAAISGLAGSPACGLCGAPIPEGSACPFCNGAGVAPFERIVALGAFREPLRKMVHEMKYRHRWPVAEILADAMFEQPRIRRVLDEIDVLVPVPLYWSRQIGRGYNQADALARQLARRCQGVFVKYPIVRLKNTSAQTSVYAAADRAANLRLAFGLVNGKSISGKRVALVDDVITTGSTVKAAARAIKQAGPASIRGIAVAIADPRRRDFQGV